MIGDNPEVSYDWTMLILFKIKYKIKASCSFSIKLINSIIVGFFINTVNFEFSNSCPKLDEMSRFFLIDFNLVQYSYYSKR